MRLNLIPKPVLPLLLLSQQTLPLRNLRLNVLQMPVNLLASHLRIHQPLLHDRDVLIEGGEVIGEHAELFVEVGDGMFGACDLALVGRHGSALLGLDIKQQMDLSLHLVFLVLQLIRQHLQLLVCELLLRELLSEHRAILPLPLQLQLQPFQRVSQLLPKFLEVAIFFGQIFTEQLARFDLFLHVFEFGLKFPAAAAEVLLVAYPQHLQLVAFLLLELAHSLLLKSRLLHHFALIHVFLVLQLLHL